MRYKQLSGYTESDDSGRNPLFRPVRIETINGLAEEGWRVVSCGFNDQGDIVACLMERDE